MYLPEKDKGVVNSKQDWDPIDKFLWPNLPYAVQFNGSPMFEPRGYMTDYLTDEAVKSIKANRNRPFFMFFAPNAIHTPLQAKKEDYDALPQIKDHRLRVYGAMVRNLDRNVGRVMAELKAQGLDDNTIVIFTSDNGGERFSDNWPLVGGKMDLTEGGIRVPWIAHWPTTIAPGGISPQHCMTMDWSATMMALGGANIHVDYPLDGVSLAGVLRNPAHTFERPMHWRMNHRGQRAMRVGDWKYLRVDGNDYLFNLPADARERANLGGRQAAQLQDLRARWEAWNATMPAIPDDAAVNLGYSVKDMPQR
jgi:arylsulfatase A-like enzyme